MGFDMDMAGFDGGSAIGSVEVKARRNWTVRCMACAKRTWRRARPLSRDLRFITSRYGTACGSLFLFQRFLLLLSVLVLFAHLPLLVLHVMNGNPGRLDAYGAGADAFTLCPTPLFPVPCSFFYGGFYTLRAGERDPWLALRYLGAMLASAGLMLYLTLLRWMQWDANLQSEMLEEDMRPRRWSKLVFQAWDFRLVSAEDKQNWGQSFATRLRAIMAEEEQARANAQRTRCQRYLLLLQRGFGLVLNLAFIACAWVAVYLSTVNRRDISNTLSSVVSGPVGEQVAGLAPNLVISAVGAALPKATKTLTSMESWAPATRARQNLWRLYLGKVLNLVVIIGLNVELLAGSPLYGNDSVLVEHDSLRYACAEDQAAAEFTSLVATELLVGMLIKPVSDLVSAWLTHKLLKCAFKSTEKFQKPEFEIADSAVQEIYFQCLLWVTQLLVPPMAVITPLLLLLNFKWSKFALVRLTSRPFVSETSALSVTLLQILGFSCIVYAGLVYTLVSRPLPHSPSCGPFKSGVAPWQMVTDMELPGVAVVTRILTAFATVILASILVISVVALLKSAVGLRAHRAAIDQLQAVLARNVDALQQELARLERQGELMKKRLEWHEKQKATV
uniref:TMC domain-containing protein n=1 Tax=Zooxanthella nutricula TaxID=1333877 RepID=A0A7S2JMI8_9DINO